MNKQDPDLRIKTQTLLKDGRQLELLQKSSRFQQNLLKHGKKDKTQKENVEAGDHQN